MFKSKNHLKLLSVLLFVATVFSLLQFPKVRAATVSYSENFAATTYKDASITTADWNTSLTKTQLNSYSVSNKTALYPTPAGGYMVSLSFVDASNGWGISDVGAVIKTTNGGGTWTRQASIKSPNDIQMIDSSNGFISTGSGLYKTTDGGSTWTAQTLPTMGSVNSIHFITSTTGWGTQNSGQVIKTTDGSNWSAIATGTSNNLRGIYFVDASTGYTAGDSGTILKTTNGGDAWSALTSGTSENLSSVYFLDANTGWVGGANGIVLRTTNGGTTWTSSDAGDFEVRHIKFVDASKGWLVKDGDTGALYSADGGATWTGKAAPSDKVARGGLYVLNADTVWVGYESGTIKYTSNGTGAATWTTQTTSTGFTGMIKDISMTGSSTGYAVSLMGSVLRTTDGSTWSYVGTVNTDNTNGIDCYSDSTCIVVAKSGKIYKTTNSGAAWTQKGAGLTSNELRDVYMNADGTGATVGDGGTILTTSDGGENWTSRTSGTTQNLSAVTYADSSTIYATGANGTVVKSTNSGTSWTSVNITGASAFRSGICASDASTVWVVHSDQNIYKTTNGGTSWTNQGGGGTPLGGLYACQAISSSIAWAVGENGLVWETTGNSWFQIGTWTNTTTVKFDLAAIDFPSGSTTGWFIGEGDTGLFKITPTGTTQYQGSNTVQSTRINTGEETITSATLTASSTLNGETITYYLSADGGSHWAAVTSGQTYTFTNYGGPDLRWKAVLTSSTGANTPTLNSVSISYVTSAPVGPSTPPTATVPTFSSQATNGSGYVTFTTTIDDTDKNDTKLNIQYSSDGGTTWYTPYIVSVTATSGSPDVSNTIGKSISRNPYRYNSKNYSAFTLRATGEGLLLLNGNSGNVNTDFLAIGGNSLDITPRIHESPQTWNLALISKSTTYTTVVVDDSVFSNQSTLNTYLDGLGTGNWTVDFWANDLYTWSNNQYQYKAPTGPTVITTYQQVETPYIKPSLAPGLSIGSTTPISTTTANTLTIVWDTKNAYNAQDVSDISSSNIKISVTPSDPMFGEQKTSSAFSIDNAGPSSGLTTFSAGTVTASSVALAWTPSSADDFNHYEIWYGTNAGVIQSSPNKEWDNSDAVNLATVATATTTITGLTAGTKYYFKIWAVDNYGNGTFSEEKYATTVATTVELPGTGEGGSPGSGEAVVGGSGTTVESVANEQQQSEELKEAIKPVVVTTAPAQTQELPKAETGKAQVNPNAAEIAIKALETAPATEAATTTKENLTEDQKNAEIVNVAISGGLTSAETAVQITKAEKIINDVVQKSIQEAITSASATGGVGGGGGITLTVNDGNMVRQVTVKSLNDIELKVELGRDKSDANYKKQVAKEKEDALGRGKELIIINETTNLDDNDVADAYQIAHNIPLFNDDPDKDGYTTSEEIFLGLNPLKADAAPLKPVITNMNGKVVLSGKDPISFRIAGKAGDKVKLALVPKKDREKILSLQQKSLYTSILLSDLVTNISPSSRQVDLGSAVIDEHNQGELTVNKIIENGEYYVIAEGKYGVGPASKFTIDNALDTATPKLNIVEYKRGLPYTIQIPLDLVEKIFKKFDKKNYILAYGGKDNLNARMYISGTADPGVTLYATWASRILSSVVLSDAKGNFEIDIPKKLVQGNHQVLVYAERGGKRTAISGVTKLVLTKK